jgi:hypothetical protein
MSEWAAPEGFGQETCYTCALACLRYLLHHLGQHFTEGELRSRLSEHTRRERLTDPSYSPEEYGYSDEAVALLCCELGFRPRLRRIAGVVPWQEVPADWLWEGSEVELVDWLRQMTTTYRPVKVCLDLWRFLHPYEAPPDNYRPEGHSVVVTTVDETVQFLEPDPLDQGQYPKAGRFRSIPLRDFIDAWKAAFCCSFALDRRDL